MGEDCLYLNVWTPAKSADEKLPVLVWYFGGGYQWGYTAEMEFDGEHLASRGIIVVSVNYRLGLFGYLAPPELTKEAPEAPANFGLLDQKAGLHWVYENIKAFGGDPEKITIAGQSAGGGSVMNQMAHSGNFHILKGAVVLSGMMRPKQDSAIFKPITLPVAEKRGQEFFEFCGFKSLDEARKADPFDLRAKYGKFVRNHERMFPICDGKFSVADPMERFVNGESADIPVMAGNTADEFLEDGESFVERSVKTAFLEVGQKKPEKKCFYYRFDPDIPGWDHPGTFHSVDLWFWFESLGKCWRPFAGRHFDLARDMADYLANFVKTGDPNGPSTGEKKLPVWETYTKDNKAEMIFDGRGAVPAKEGGIRLGNTGKKQAVNPYLPSWEFVPDGEPYVFDDRVYVYGSHDLYDGETFCLGDYVCWSAPVNNLGDWHYEGVIYDKTADPLNKDGHMCLYAPDVTVGPDGRYYLYYVLDKVSVVSVAVSDRPAGPFEFYGYVHYEDGTKLGEKPGDEPQFDPGVLTEGNETYLYTGFAGHGDNSRHGAMFTVLDADMLTVKKAPVFVCPGDCYSEGTEFEGHAFFEAPSIRKKDGKYFFIYSSELMHELCYATSDKPEGPFKYGGVLVSNCDKNISSYKPADMSMAYGGNNHGSMIEIGGSWYIFYHRQTNNTWFSRQVCAEKLSFNSDGSIKQAEITSCGLNEGPLSDMGEYPAYIVCNLFTEKHSTYVEDNSPAVVMEGGDGDASIGYIKKMYNGATAGFKYFDMKKVLGVKIKTRGYFNGKAEIRTKWDGEVLGEIALENSNVWAEGICRFEPVSGVNALFITFKGNGSCSLKSFELLH
jgi:carboxylesterase type B